MIDQPRLWPILREKLQSIVTHKRASLVEIGKIIMPWAEDNVARSTVHRWLHGGSGFPGEPKAEATLRLQQIVQNETQQCPCCGKQLEEHFTK